MTTGQSKANDLADLFDFRASSERLNEHGVWCSGKREASSSKEAVIVNNSRNTASTIFCHTRIPRRNEVVCDVFHLPQTTVKLHQPRPTELRLPRRHPGCQSTCTSPPYHIAITISQLQLLASLQQLQLHHEFRP
jgi:hypothetical protein